MFGMQLPWRYMAKVKSVNNLFGSLYILVKKVRDQTFKDALLGQLIINQFFNFIWWISTFIAFSYATNFEIVHHLSYTQPFFKPD